MEQNPTFVKVQIARFPAELHREVRIRALRAGETMGQWVARACSNQVVLEDGAAEVLEAPGAPAGLEERLASVVWEGPLSEGGPVVAVAK